MVRICDLKIMIDDTYKKHRVFSSLQDYINFYKSLSFSIFDFITRGTKAICNIDSYVFSSIQGTLESIRDILIQGHINDSYALLRKYYDSTIINIYTNLYLSDKFNYESFIVNKIDNWVHGKDKLPEYRVMSQYIRKSDKLSKINELLYKDTTYKSIRDRCNDHTHYNFFQNMLYNDDEIYLKYRLESLNIFSKDLDNILVMHFSYLFYLNDHYMMSSDYIDSLECGITPEEGSQYYVAPFVQKIFNDVIKKNRSDLAKIIKSNTSMKLV